MKDEGSNASNREYTQYTAVLSLPRHNSFLLWNGVVGCVLNQLEMESLVRSG